MQESFEKEPGGNTGDNSLPENNKNNNNNNNKNNNKNNINKRKSSPLKIFFYVFAVLLILTAATGVFFLAKSMLEPVDPGATEETVLINVPRGVSTAHIALILEKEGIIHNALAFRLYIRFMDPDALLQAGDYQLSPSFTMEEIIQKMKKGDVYIETEWFVIPEGYDVRRMAQHLAEEGLAEENEFLELARSPNAAILEQFPFIEEVPADTDYTLEGYLFPSKYEIESGASVEEILVIMLRRFQRFLTEENMERIAELGMTIHEVVTLASIIEREAASDREWDLVSSVFHNRLNIGMLLQSCATIQYALGEVKEVLFYEDLEVESLYNTYKYPGLPPGPISSPGEAALKAAIYPAETDYYYFVSRGDGSGEHLFGKTLADHEANRARVR